MKLIQLRSEIFCVPTGSFTILMSLLLSSVAPGIAEVKADRTRLTFRDGGLYCNYSMWHGLKPAKADNMLPAQRAASEDSPWSFYIMQYRGGDEPRATHDGALIREMAKHGKKVILRAHIGRLTKNPDVDEMERRIATSLTEVNPGWLYAITLDEEQVYWNGWAAALAELYRRCKKRWPDLPVYQWWTPMKVPDVRAKSGWVALPADGWVIDLYGRKREEFEKKVAMCLETGKPVVHIAWASPEWPDHSGAESWEKGGRQVFDDQLEVCRAYDVPVAYFCTQKAEIKDGKRFGIRWGWHAADPLVRNWYRQLETITMNHRYLPASQIGFRTPDKRLYDWAHETSVEPEIRYSLDGKVGKRFTWRPNLAGLPIKAGEHVLQRKPHAKLTLTLDKSAAKLDGALAVRSIRGYVNQVPLVFKIEPLQPVEDLIVTADVSAIKVLGGSAEISVSQDGATWSEPRRSDPSKRKIRLSASSQAKGRSRTAFWIRLLLRGNAGVPSNRAAALNALEISASFEPPL